MNANRLLYQKYGILKNPFWARLFISLKILIYSKNILNVSHSHSRTAAEEGDGDGEAHYNFYNCQFQESSKKTPFSNNHFLSVCVYVCLSFLYVCDDCYFLFLLFVLHSIVCYQIGLPILR